MIEEIGLIALAIYLLRKGTPDYKLTPKGPEWRDIARANRQQTGSTTPPEPPEHKWCPYFWTKRPAIFNVVPINPKSRKNWRTLCRIWIEIKELGLEIRGDEALIPAKSKEEDFSQLEQKIKNAKNRQAFLLKEAKRIANIQKRMESLYVESLKNIFSENEIKDFYIKRKEEIMNGIWPQTNTQVVPIISAGSSRDKSAVDVGVIDTSNTAIGI